MIQMIKQILILNNEGKLPEADSFHLPHPDLITVRNHITEAGKQQQRLTQTTWKKQVSLAAIKVSDHDSTISLGGINGIMGDFQLKPTADPSEHKGLSHIYKNNLDIPPNILWTNETNFSEDVLQLLDDIP